MKRRKILKGLGVFGALGALGSLPISCLPGRPQKIKIANTEWAVEKEPLIQPFGFKGGYLTELWQSVAHVIGSSGESAIGLGTQSVLWSDSRVFANNSESQGNSMML